ncbi:MULTISPECIES: replicative DNA helicase [Sporomusa]|uniref:Replicative DNA helicase n=1 Tax=Sporomusa sphaeroides DSM 2875 TaxID=1337886 RepID=A0ABP2C805_9FIRM|nr:MULTISPECIES: replicative DNA helicase [Sporomusa]MCM0759352.1 replicative DNA helicase [Sporomusa sphaeroides DSM 2875]OLS56440.1 replicative DNA helicase [Sporomusa sphaeroides DSM 2875]CVK18535.1 Replicative DNA helicase [Sporomusa sphaeroides DSM 2875]
MIDRVPPQNVEAEQAVLGAMMIEREAISKVSEVIRPEDFYREAHRLIFNAMMELFNKNEAVDLVTVVEVLRRDEKLEGAGGIAYVSALANSVPTAANVMYHARIVEEKALLRQLINTATHVAGMGYEANEEVAVIMDKAEKLILEVSNRKAGQEFASIKNIIFDVFDKVSELYSSKGGITGLPTGFKDLDKLTSGLQPSDLILIAARPSMGKTAFVLNIAQNIAVKEKKAVAFFSLEMSKEQLVQRMLCAEAPIDAQRLRIGELENNDWDKLVRAADRLAAAPIFIDDTAGITVMEMRSKARRLKIEHDLQLIIIDYLQLMQGGTGSSRSENRQQEISEISRSLKALARELKVPVIALSQLSRGVESRQVKKPMLSDLRESGSLEQDADIVAFIYREDYYEPETERKNITDIIVAKHRNGPVDSVQLFFHKQFTKFSDLSRISG